MATIEINRVGEIVAGEDRGQFVKVIDDAENTGGYLIVTSKNIEMAGGFDCWVEDKEKLGQFFTESGWEIRWL